MAAGRQTHGYAPAYAQHLRSFVRDRRRLTLLEVGILKGSGLAIWSDLFPDARILGLDIDLSHARDHWPVLESRGAFAANNVELHEFDQLAGTADDLAALLKEDRLDVVIDDGLHTEPAVLRTLACVMPFLASDFVYFVEDNRNVHQVIARLYPQFSVKSYGELTVILPPSTSLASVT
jgi:hypothetical protein